MRERLQVVLAAVVNEGQRGHLKANGREVLAQFSAKGMGRWTAANQGRLLTESRDLLQCLPPSMLPTDDPGRSDGMAGDSSLELLPERVRCRHWRVQASRLLMLSGVGPQPSCLHRHPLRRNHHP